jgi:predicted ribonuclease YlaK
MESAAGTGGRCTASVVRCVRQFLVNQFLYQEGERPLQAIVRSLAGDDRRTRDADRLQHAKNSVWGITARNREQNFALNLLMNPDVISSPCSARPAPARRC